MSLLINKLSNKYVLLLQQTIPIKVQTYKIE